MRCTFDFAKKKKLITILQLVVLHLGQLETDMWDFWHGNIAFEKIFFEL